MIGSKARPQACGIALTTLLLFALSCLVAPSVLAGRSGPKKDRNAQWQQQQRKEKHYREQKGATEGESRKREREEHQYRLRHEGGDRDAGEDRKYGEGENAPHEDFGMEKKGTPQQRSVED